jgi:hypothetical protein
VQWLIDILKWLGETPLSLAIAQSEWMFPAFEVVHIFAISMVFGTVAIIDLRLLGFASGSPSGACRIPRPPPKRPVP